MDFGAQLLSLAAQLRHAGITPEIIAEYGSRRHPVLPWRRVPHFRVLAECWRLGSFLLTPAGELWWSENSVRAARRERLGVVSDAQEARRDVAGWAFKSGIAERTQVNYHAVPLQNFLSDPETQPSPTPALVYAAGEVKVLWHASATVDQAPPLIHYLTERCELLLLRG